MNSIADESKFEMIRSLYYSLDPEITEEIWQSVKSKYYLRTVKKGTQLLAIGQTCKFVGIVLSGLLRMYHTVENKEVIFDFYEAGRQLSDYSSFILREPAVSTIDALEDSEILFIDYEDVEYLYSIFPMMYKMVTASLDMLYVNNFKKYNAILLDDLETRYRNFLSARSSLVPRIPQYMIASYLGVTPEALSRMRRGLKKDVASKK